MSHFAVLLLEDGAKLVLELERVRLLNRRKFERLCLKLYLAIIRPKIS